MCTPIQGSKDYFLLLRGTQSLRSFLPLKFHNDPIAKWFFIFIHQIIFLFHHGLELPFHFLSLVWEVYLKTNLLIEVKTIYFLLTQMCLYYRVFQFL